MQSTGTRECSRPSSVFAGMLSPGLSTHSSNHTFSPSCRSRSATARTTALSFALWLRKTSWVKTSVVKAWVQLSTMRGHAPLTLPKWRVSFGNSGEPGSGQTGLPLVSR